MWRFVVVGKPLWIFYFALNNDRNIRMRTIKFTDEMAVVYVCMYVYIYLP